MSERRRIAGATSVLPGQSPPIALMWTPGPTMLSVRIVAYCLSAVQVVMMCSPSIASSGVLQAVRRSPRPARFRMHFAVAAGSMSKSRTASTPQTAFMASAWNSDCAPFPIIAMTRAPAGARWRATMAEVAAVRSAVRSVISDRSTG
jgi:hypothetical protein